MYMRVVIIGALLFLAVGVGFGISKYLNTSPTTDEMKTGVQNETPHIIAKSVQEETENFKIHMKYPNFGLSSIDQKIQGEIDRIVLEFKAESSTHTPVPYELSSIYDLTYIGSDIVSARLAVSTYLGGAHPGTGMYGLNYDRETGRELTLDDALNLIGLSLHDVAGASRQQLSKKLEDAFFEEGTAPVRENYSTFIVGSDSVTFLFQEYQVGPYAVGPQEVSFVRKK